MIITGHEKVRLRCRCLCEFIVQPERFKMSEPVRCPNCMEEFVEGEAIVEALKLFQRVHNRNTDITFEIIN